MGDTTKRRQTPEWKRTSINIDENEWPEIEKLKDLHKVSLKGLFDLGIEALDFMGRIPHPNAMLALQTAGVDNLISEADTARCSELMARSHLMIHTPDFGTWTRLHDHFGILRQRIQQNLVTEIYLVPTPDSSHMAREASAVSLLFDGLARSSDTSKIKVFLTKFPLLDIIVSDGFGTLWAPAVFQRKYALIVRNTKDKQALDFHKAITGYVADLPKADIKRDILYGDRPQKLSRQSKTRKAPPRTRKR